MSFQQIEPNDQSLKERITHLLRVSAFLQPLRIGEHVFREYYSSETSSLAWLGVFANLYNGDRTDDESDSAESENDEPETPPNWKGSSFWAVIRSLEQLSLIDNTGQYPNSIERDDERSREQGKDEDKAKAKTKARREQERGRTNT
ncbi:hypothetical protein LTR28_011663 [Elasticomyces elasticus]|nr:hypothetical protein LTR28_011663 [Elasticomyces elasticus]